MAMDVLVYMLSKLIQIDTFMIDLQTVKDAMHFWFVFHSDFGCKDQQVQLPVIKISKLS